MYQIEPDGSYEVVASGLAGPVDVGMDGIGNLYVTNFNGAAVSRIAPDGTVSRHATVPAGPAGIVVDQDGTVYVAHYGAGNGTGRSVTRIAADGTVSEFARSAEMVAPIGLARGPGGDLYAANFYNGKIFRIDAAGELSLFAQVRLPNGAGAPIGHIAAGNGGLIATTLAQNRIYYVSPEGEASLLSGDGSAIVTDGPFGAATFERPNGLAEAPTGEVYIATAGSGPGDRSTLRRLVFSSDFQPTFPAAGARPTTAAPNWSPDGKALIFSSDVTGTAQIWRMTADGNEQQRLSDNDAVENNASYSPDGQYIAFVSDITGSPQIWTMAADGSGRTQLTEGPLVAAQPRWGPSGSHLYYSAGGAEEGSRKDLYWMRADGSGSEKISTSAWSEIYPVPSPVDDRLLSAGKHPEGDFFQILMRPSAGAEPVNISHRAAPTYNPDWSPDGEWVAFISQAGETFFETAIFVARSDGSEARQLTDFPEGAYQPRWSPDGRSLAFRRGWNEHVGLFRINVDGSGLVQLTNVDVDTRRQR